MLPRKWNQWREEHDKKETSQKLGYKSDSIPKESWYTASPVSPITSAKMAAALKSMDWTEDGTKTLGWKSAEVALAPDKEEEGWRRTTSLAARLMQGHLLRNPKWTYSNITVAKGKHMKDLLLTGGIGASVVWTWALAGGVAARVGRSSKFNAHGRLVEFHAKTAASLFPGGEEAYAMLLHNFSNAPYEDPALRRSLKDLGLAPDPKDTEETNDDDYSTTEEEDEDLSFP